MYTTFKLIEQSYNYYGIFSTIIKLMLSTNSVLSRMVHTKCRNSVYPRTHIQRIIFADEFVSWSVPFKSYTPIEYNSPALKNEAWADPDIDNEKFKPLWNSVDKSIDRTSHEGDYTTVNGRPINIQGRTGLSGRGILGRWGPNHAADPIVTRWKIIDNIKVVDSTSNLPLLQFCAIQRRDCNEWAIPGGMVDPGENVSETLRREFAEEALNSLETDDAAAKEMINNFFSRSGEEIYKGYVDDPRNTDNAWMETVATNFHDDYGETVGKLHLNAGDDAKGVKWMDIDNALKLYASHRELIKKVAILRKAHW